MGICINKQTKKPNFSLPVFRMAEVVTHNLFGIRVSAEQNKNIIYKIKTNGYIEFCEKIYINLPLRLSFLLKRIKAMRKLTLSLNCQNVQVSVKKKKGGISSFQSIPHLLSGIFSLGSLIFVRILALLSAVKLLSVSSLTFSHLSIRLIVLIL